MVKKLRINHQQFVIKSITSLKLEFKSVYI